MNNEGPGDYDTSRAFACLVRPHGLDRRVHEGHADDVVAVLADSARRAVTDQVAAVLAILAPDRVAVARGGDALINPTRDPRDVTLRPPRLRRRVL